MGSEKYKIAKALEIGTEFKLPVSASADAPELGVGAQRANPTTGAPQYWNGAEWVDVEGGDTTNWTPGNSFAS